MIVFHKDWKIFYVLVFIERFIIYSLKCLRVVLIQETTFLLIFTLFFSFVCFVIARRNMSMLKTEENLTLLLMFCSRVDNWCVRHMKESFVYNCIPESSHLPVLFSSTSYLMGEFFCSCRLYHSFPQMPYNLIICLKPFSLLRSSSLPDIQMHQLRCFFFSLQVKHGKDKNRRAH